MVFPSREQAGHRTNVDPLSDLREVLAKTAYGREIGRTVWFDGTHAHHRDMRDYYRIYESARGFFAAQRMTGTGWKTIDMPAAFYQLLTKRGAQYARPGTVACCQAIIRHCALIDIAEYDASLPFTASDLGRYNAAGKPTFSRSTPQTKEPK